jgi:hypothetical protein
MPWRAQPFVTPIDKRDAANAAKLRFGVPVAALRWLADQASNAPKAPQDIELATTDESLRVSAAANRSAMS